jgi:hypothetical protein
MLLIIDVILKWRKKQSNAADRLAAAYSRYETTLFTFSSLVIIYSV